MFIPDPDFQTWQQKRGVKKNVLYLFCSHKLKKIVNYLIFGMLKKKIWSSFQRIIELFTQNFVTALRYGFGIQDPEKPIPGSGSRGQKGPGSATLFNTLKKYFGLNYTPIDFCEQEKHSRIADKFY
jgi:hypothetical protein